MKPNDDFRAYLKAAAQRFDREGGECITDGQLIAYVQGAPSAEVHETVESHLVLCPHCRKKLLEARDFLGSGRVGEAILSAREIDQDWRSVSRRIAGLRKLPDQPRSFGRPGKLFALAASILLMVGFSAGWGVQYTRQNTRIQQVVRRAENEISTLRRQQEADRQQLAQLRLPRVNTSIYDIFSTQSLSRGVGTQQVNRIRLSNDTGFTLILNGHGQRTFPRYSVEILDDRGRHFWRAEDLAPGADRNFVITFPGGFLAEGNYRLRLSGKVGSGYEHITDYAFSLERAGR